LEGGEGIAVGVAGGVEDSQGGAIVGVFDDLLEEVVFGWGRVDDLFADVGGAGEGVAEIPAVDGKVMVDGGLRGQLGSVFALPVVFDFVEVVAEEEEGGGEFPPVDLGAEFLFELAG
jgi:hypothetical protein